MPQPLRRRLEKTLAAWPWRRAGILAGVSLGLALLLVGYLFGVNEGFLGRLFSAAFVLFWLLAITYFAIVPFVTWASGNWFGRRWRAVAEPAPRRAPAGSSARSYSSPAAVRRPETK
jgi:FAD/FMN-containing dehydrogenase